MKRAALTAVILASLQIVAAGHLLGSNMAFQLNYRLNGPAFTGGVGFGKNTLALPYVRQSGLNDSFQLMRDIGGGGIIGVNWVARFSESSDSFAVYTGRMGSPGPNFPLVAGDGYFVSVAHNFDHRVVGVHDPSFVLQLDAPGTGSKSGTNFVALPYHVTSANAMQLMLDIGGGSILPVVSVSRFEAATDTYSVYTGRMGSASLLPFPLKPGEAYFVSMKVTVPYTPSHY